MNTCICLLSTVLFWRYFIGMCYYSVNNFIYMLSVQVEKRFVSNTIRLKQYVPCFKPTDWKQAVLKIFLVKKEQFLSYEMFIWHERKLLLFASSLDRQLWNTDRISKEQVSFIKLACFASHFPGKSLAFIAVWKRKYPKGKNPAVFASTLIKNSINVHFYRVYYLN